MNWGFRNRIQRVLPGLSTNNGSVMVATCVSSTLATILMIIAEKSKEIHWLLYLIMVLFLARYILTKI